MATPLPAQVPSPAAVPPTPFLTPVPTVPAQQAPPPATPATPVTQPTAPPLQAFPAPVSVATIPTIFTTFAGQPETITESGTPGTSVQFQASTDLVTWVALVTVTVDPSGHASYTFTPLRTAYYRAYSDVTGLSAPARGIVVATGQWTGYVVGNGPYSAVTGTFTVPNLLVPTTSETVVTEWVGIDGIYPNTSLIQAGISETTKPGSDQVALQPWWEILPDDPTIQPVDWHQLSVLPGHSVTVTIWQVAGSRWGISMKDSATGQIYTTVQDYSGPGTSADWIVEAPANIDTASVYKLGQFTSDIAFSKARFVGEPAAVDRSATEELPPIVQAGVTVAVPSALSGGGFTVAYGATPPAAP